VTNIAKIITSVSRTGVMTTSLLNTEVRNDTDVYSEYTRCQFPTEYRVLRLCTAESSRATG